MLLFCKDIKKMLSDNFFVLIENLLFIELICMENQIRCFLFVQLSEVITIKA